jgi:2-polyprenyl-3-methyl-5-hydroxy-6-metoxy-1,4-benzoquinol methylase
MNTVPREFGTRELKTPTEVFTYNAWDNIIWDENDEEIALQKINIQTLNPVPPEKVTEFNNDPVKYWDSFYSIHANKFFKNRNWLQHEFPELFKDNVKNLLEVGCGVGNTVFPYLQSRPDTFVYCCDYSSEAIKNVKVCI